MNTNKRWIKQLLLPFLLVRKILVATSMSYYKLSRCDIRFLNILYKIGNTLAIIPVYSFEKCTIVAPSLNKIYAFFLILLEIFCTTWLIYVRHSDKEIHFFTLTFTILGTCDNLILGMLKISLIFGVCCCKQREWVKLNNKFQCIDKQFKIRNHQEKKLLKNTYVQFALCNIVYVFIVMYTLVIRSLGKGISTLKMFALHELSGYYNVFAQILIWNMALAFRVRYRHLNKQLSRISYNNARKNLHYMKQIGKTSRLLGEMVVLFNEIFGLPLVFITGRCVLKILTSLTFFTSTLKFDDSTLKRRLEFSSLSQTASVLVSISILILACDSARSESHKAVLLCYKLRERFPDKSEEQMELLELAQIIEKHRATFTAAEFFDINRATLFGILGTTTTYLIVTIQFNHSLDNSLA